MKQRGKFFLILLVAACLSVSFSFTQQNQPQPVRMEKISDRLYQILGGRGASGGFYVGDDGVLVIDTKMTKESVDETLAGIGKITDKPVKFLVNTHSDGDHIAGNRYFPETVTIVAHENCRKDFFLPQRDGKPSEWKSPELAPFVPSVTFGKKMDIHLGTKKVELWYFGVGHTTGDTVVYFPEEKTAFVGDQIFAGRPQLIHSYKGGNSFEHVETLAKMLETLEAEKFCSGHADPMDRSAVQQHIDQMKKMQEKVRSLMEQGKSLEEVKTEFAENEARLVESIFNEIKTKSGAK